jgi:hypothetical protein
MGSQRIADDRLHVITSISADEAGLDTHAMFGELGQSSLDGLSHRLGIPRPGHPIWIESDYEDPGRSAGVHIRTIRVEWRSNREDSS